MEYFLTPFCLAVLMNQYFGRMRSLMNNKDLPARIRFLLQDTLDLRENNWVPRKAFIDNGPKTINQIRQDAVKVRPFQLLFDLLELWVSLECINVVNSFSFWAISCFVQFMQIWGLLILGKGELCNIWRNRILTKPFLFVRKRIAIWGKKITR